MGLCTVEINFLAVDKIFCPGQKVFCLGQYFFVWDNIFLSGTKLIWAGTKYILSVQMAWALHVAGIKILAMDKMFCLRQKNFVPDKIYFVRADGMGISEG